MKKHTQRRSAETPVDQLFAQKLTNMSLPPAPGSFERLQSRLELRPARPAVNVWRNVSVQRYAAVAACLLLVALVGGLYRNGLPEHQPAVAVHLPPSIVRTHSPASSRKSATIPSDPSASAQRTNWVIPSQATAVSKASGINNQNQPLTNLANGQTGTYQENTEEGASTKPSAAGSQQVVATVVPSSDPGVANTPANIELPGERVLIVTIAEPDALVAARQAAQQAENQRAVASTTALPANETKTAAPTVWQQVKRLKQGQTMARRTNADDDRNLLSRAYSGLRQTLEKDKPTKQ